MTDTPTEPEDIFLPYGADDDQITTRIAESWKGKVAYFHNQWWVYEGGCWIERDVQQVRKSIRVFLQSYRDKLKGGITQGRIGSVANMLEDEYYIPDRRLIAEQQASERYINLRNGLFNLETFLLEDHRPDMYLTSQLDFEYDPDATCPVFKRFLRTSLANEDGTPDTDMIMLAMEALSYSLTARTDFKASFWLIGVPNTGKSTLVGFLRRFMGSLHKTVNLNQLASNRFILSGIVGARVVTFTEAESNTFLPDALYKAMVGGRDAIQVDVKNKPAIEFVPQAKFWWAMNTPPRVNDRSGATLNRLLPILFEHVITESEMIPDLDHLLDEERAGVFNELIIAWRRLLKYGKFTSPERSNRWRENYRRVNDTEFLYSEDRWERDVNASIPGQRLYDDYRAWCERNGFKPKNLGQIGAEWKRLGLTNSQSNGRSFWHGANLKDAQP